MNKKWYVFFVTVTGKKTTETRVKAVSLFCETKSIARLKLVDTCIRLSNKFWHYEISPYVEDTKDIVFIDILGEIKGIYGTCRKIEVSMFKDFKLNVHNDVYSEIHLYEIKEENGDNFSHITDFV